MIVNCAFVIVNQKCNFMNLGLNNFSAIRDRTKTPRGRLSGRPRPYPESGTCMLDVRSAAKTDLTGLLDLYTRFHDNAMPRLDEGLSALWVAILADTNHHVIVGISGERIVSSCVMVIVPNLTHNQRPYAFIENVRTMDKAVRGIRTNLLPELGGSLYIDPETGLLQSYTVEHLKTVANRALEEMEKAGELSGYYVDIDPAQNVLATSTVEFVIKQVGVGVMRKIRIKIGFYESI